MKRQEILVSLFLAGAVLIFSVFCAVAKADCIDDYSKAESMATDLAFTSNCYDCYINAHQKNIKTLNWCEKAEINNQESTHTAQCETYNDTNGKGATTFCDGN
jgi:hypothetical protein